MTNLAGFFASLEGPWTLNKTIVHGESSPEHNRRWTFTGTAHYEKMSSGDLHYREQGVLMPESAMEPRLQAWQDYVFAYEDHELHIFFAQGRKRKDLFLTFQDNSTGTDGMTPVAATHVCSADTYRTTLTRDDAMRHTLTHVVCGPRKNYTATSAFTRPAP
jgi:hypothetical protein